MKFLTTLCAASLLLAGNAFAQSDYPNKPIRIIVPLAAGGVTDVFARVTARQLEKELGATVIVENRAGGDGVIASSYVAQAKPDGYTLMLAIPALAIDPALGRKLPYDALRDFEMIGLIGTSPNYLVASATLPVKDVKGLVDMVHKNPGKFNYGHPGVGTTAHLSFEVFKLEARLDVNAIPYKGSAPMIVELANGQVAMTSMAAVLTMSESRAGRVKVLATTALQRTPEFPDVPTMAEAGYPAAMVTPWFGIIAPAGMPRADSAKLAAALARSVASTEVKSALANVGSQASGATPAEFRALVERETVKWMDVVKKAGVTITAN